MTAAPVGRPDPFFVGDHLALDFINTIAVPAGAPIEWLANGADLVDWLSRTGAIDAATAARFRKGQAIDAVAEEARSLREWLLPFLLRHAGHAVKASTLSELAPLNRLLGRGDSYRQVVASKERAAGLAIAQQRRWTTPEQLLQPIAEAIADLVCHTDFRLIRSCEGPTCTLMFYDRTKGHGRRWCSMKVCG